MSRPKQPHRNGPPHGFSEGGVYWRWGHLEKTKSNRRVTVGPTCSEDRRVRQYTVTVSKKSRGRKNCQQPSRGWSRASESTTHPRPRWVSAALPWLSVPVTTGRVSLWVTRLHSPRKRPQPLLQWFLTHEGGREPRGVCTPGRPCFLGGPKSGAGRPAGEGGHAASDGTKGQPGRVLFEKGALGSSSEMILRQRVSVKRMHSQRKGAQPG